MKQYFLLCFISLVSCFSWSQTISGKLTGMPNVELRLEGFNGMQSYTISTTTTDKQGKFSLAYKASDYGMGFLQAKDSKAFILVLSPEPSVLEGNSLDSTEEVHFTKGAENLAFERYALEQPRREQTLSAWSYLEQIYTKDSLFLSQAKPILAIKEEQQRLADESEAFLQKLPTTSYVRWFLPIRRLVSSLSAIAMNRPAEIPEALQGMRKLNYADPRLYKSGLFKDALEGHIWFIENSSGPLDKVFADINQSLDIILPQLAGDSEKYTQVTDFLFHLLEQKSLFTSSEYLALKVLEEQSCTLPDKLSNQLEGYRKLKKGKTAPNIVFGEHTYAPKGNKVSDLKSIHSPYKLVVFAASWCSHCQEMLPKIVKEYPSWKEKGVEVVFVSLDDQLSEFASFAGGFPFISTCDLKKWEGKAALDYHLFGTPTLYLLNQDLEILLKPISAEQVSAWLSVQSSF